MTDPVEAAGGDGTAIAGLAGAVLDEEARTHAAAAPERVVLPDDLLPGVGAEKMTLREGLRLGGPAIFLVLLALNSLDELEGAALAVLAPDIRSSFGISDGMMVLLGGAAGAFIVLGAVPMGWLADRYRRGPIIGVASAVFAGMVLCSGLAVNAFMFFWARFGAGIAKSNTLPVHGSMLADAYPITVRGRISAATSIAGRVLSILSPVLVGVIAVRAGGADGWRWAYLLLGLPVLVFAVAAFFLKEPPRGQWEKADVLGEVIEDPDTPPISTEAAFARLNSIKTLRTVMLAFAAMGFGLFTAPVLVNLYVEDAFGLDAVQRGLLATVGGLAGLAVLPFVGGYYDARYREDPARALRLIGLVTLPAAIFTPIQFFMPNPVLFAVASIPQAILLTAGFSMIGPLLQSIVPYRLRGLGASLGSIYVFFLGATGGGLLALPLTNAYGPRTAVLVMLVPATIVGGLLIVRSASSIHDDLSLVVEELREELDEHERRARDPEDVPVIQVNNLDFSYGRVQVLFDVGFEVRRGEVLALLGTNGAGKSTVLRVIEGLHTPQRGVVRLDGRTITYSSPEQRVRMGIVSLAGGEGVFPSMTVGQNLQMAAYVHRSDRSDVAARIDRVLERFPQLAERRRERAGSLSGGQQQMLALAMALIHDPQVLIIDELSLGLAPSVVADLLAVVEELRATGLAMIVVEQSLNVALALADRAIFLEKGQVRFEGDARELAERDDLARAVFLGGVGGRNGSQP